MAAKPFRVPHPSAGSDDVGRGSSLKASPKHRSPPLLPSPTVDSAGLLGNSPPNWDSAKASDVKTANAVTAGERRSFLTGDPPGSDASNPSSSSSSVS